MHSAWAPVQGLGHRTRLQQALRLGCLVILLSQSGSLAVHAGTTSGSSVGLAEVARNAPGQPGYPTQPRAVLQLLDPSSTAAEPDDGLFSGFQRWADILVGDYQTFLPMIAIFVTIGATALIFDIRRRRLLTRTRYQAGSRDPVRWRGERHTGLPRAMTPRNVSAMPRIAERSDGS